MRTSVGHLATWGVGLALSLASGVAGQGVEITLFPDAAVTLPPPEQLMEMPVDPRLRTLAEQLGSESYHERELATRELMEGLYDHRQLYALIYQERLDREQLHRMMEIVRFRLVAAPRGAVGISMQARQPEPGGPVEIEVRDLIRGLPAERLLEVGDRIVEVEDRPLTSDEDLVQAIQTRRPGDTIALTVRRADRDEEGRIRRDAEDNIIYTTLHLDVELGSTDRLFDSSRPNVRKSEFVKRREREARDALRRFGPQPVPIEVRSGISGSFVPGAEQVALADVDRHPDIVSLLQQKRFLDAAGGDVAPEVRRDWDRRLRLLIQQLHDASLTDAERTYLLRVIERFRQIIGRQ